MQQPDRRTPISRCEAASRFTQTALRTFPALFETPADTTARLESLAASLDAGTTALIASQNEYRAFVLALVAHRVRVRLVDLRADDVVRSVKRAADDAGAAVSEAVFPQGVTPIVKPVGKTEVDALRALESRIEATTRWSDRAPQLARVQAVRTAYETALAERTQAVRDAADKRALRDAIKEDFLDVFARVASAVQDVFPRDRVRQDVFFDTLRASQRDDEDEPDEPAAPTPAT